MITISIVDVIFHITSYYGFFTIEIFSPQSNHPTHQIQTDNLDLYFSKVFREYIKNIQRKNSQRVNSILKIDVFQFFIAVYLY